MAEYVLKKMSGLPLLKCEDITGNEFLGLGYLGKNYRMVINELVKYIGDVVSSRGDLPADIVEQIQSITDSIETLSGGFDVLRRDMLSHEGSIALLGAMGIPTYKGEIASGPARLDLYDSLPNPADVNDGNAVYYVSDKGCFYLVVSPGEIAGRGSKAHATFEGSDRYNIGTSSRKDQLFYNESTGFFCRVGDSGMLTVYDSGNSYSNEEIDDKIASIPTCDLGTFDSSTAAWSAAASHNIYGDRTINILTYKIKGDGTTQIIFQQHSVYTTSRANPICTQYMFFEGASRASYMRTFDLESKEMLSSWSPIHLYSMFEVEDNTVYGYTSPEDLNNKLHKKVALFSINAVTTDTDQDITGKKIFKKDISIDNKSVIAKNIDAGELKVLHNGSTKGFIIRTRKTSDAIYPLELLSTDGYNSYNYGFPAKSGTLLLEEDADAGYVKKEDIPSFGGTPTIETVIPSLIGKWYSVRRDSNGNLIVQVPWADTDTKYTLPAASSSELGGIKTGYSTNGKNYPVQLDDNNNAFVNVPWTDTKVTSSTVEGWGFTKNTGTYSKPSTGIPKSDLSSDVQTSLGKADNALQKDASSMEVKSGLSNKFVLNNVNGNSKYQFVTFRQDGATYAQLGTIGGDDLYWIIGGTKVHKIAHAGNIDEWTVATAINAQRATTADTADTAKTATTADTAKTATIAKDSEKLGGLPAEDYARSFIDYALDLDNAYPGGLAGGSLLEASGIHPNNIHGTSKFNSALLVFGGLEHGVQMLAEHDSKLWFRTVNEDLEYSSWKTLIHSGNINEYINEDAVRDLKEYNLSFGGIIDITDSTNLMSIIRNLPGEASVIGVVGKGKYDEGTENIIELPENIYKNYHLPQRVNAGDLILISKYGLKILPTNTNKERVTYTQEYYDEGNGQVVPVKHPDIATQPNILPYKLAGNYVYEQLLYVGSLGYSIRDGNAEFSMDAPKWEIESPCILKATLITSNGDNGNQVSAPCIASKIGDTIKVCVDKNFVDYKGSISDAWLLIEYSSFSNLNRYYGYGEDDGYDVTLEFYLSGGTIPLPLSEGSYLSVGGEDISIRGKSKVKLTKNQIKMLAEGGEGYIRTGSYIFRNFQLRIGDWTWNMQALKDSDIIPIGQGGLSYLYNGADTSEAYTKKTIIKFLL